MNKSEVQKLSHGLYRVYWKSGGHSLASVGSIHNGNRWIAPTNWVNFSLDASRTWRDVERVELIVRHRDNDDYSVEDFYDTVVNDETLLNLKNIYDILLEYDRELVREQKSKRSDIVCEVLTIKSVIKVIEERLKEKEQRWTQAKNIS